LVKEHVFKVKTSVIQHEIQQPSISIIGCRMFISHVGATRVWFSCCMPCIGPSVTDFACSFFWKIHLGKESDYSGGNYGTEPGK
jgi:hypothetical protein